MLTALGKELRILRIKYNEILKDMASKLGITSAYLSAIENGKREPTQKFMQALFSAYDLTDADRERIEDAYYTTIDNISINLSNQTPAQRDLSFVFARKFDTLSDEEVEKIIKLLNKGE